MVGRRSAVATAALILLWLLAPGLPPDSSADEGAPEEAIVVEDRMDIEILSGHEARLAHHRVVRILTQSGVDRYGSFSIFYNPWIEIRDLRGSVTLPSGKRIEVKRQHIAESSYTTFELYTESKLRTLLFPGVVPGSTVDVAYEQTIHSLFFLPDTIALQERVPVRLKSLAVRAPETFPMRFSVRGAAPEYSEEGNGGVRTRLWQVRDVPALKEELMMPPGEDVVPRILIAPKEILWDNRRIDASTWDGIAAWDWDLVRERIQITSEVEKTARELTAGVADPDERTRRLYDFVRQKVTYVAIYLGIGGYQPHSSGDVLRNRYGDCKDKATLLIALLRSVGLRGFPALIMTRNSGLIDRDFPAPAFNHQIVAVPQEAGGYLFLDPTSSETPYGELPWVDQGVPSLVVKDDGRGELAETPLFPAERNRRHIAVTAHLKPVGDLEGTYEIQAWGERRELLSELLAAKASEREEALADLMGWLSPGAVLQSQVVDVPTDIRVPATAKIRFTVPRFTMRAGTKEIVSPYLVRFKALTDVASYPARRHPVLFPSLRVDTSEVRLHLPPGRTLKKVPADRDLDGPGIHASSRFQLLREGDHQVLVVERSVTVSRREIPVEDYAPLRIFVSSLLEEESGAVTLESESIARALPTRE